MNKNIDAKVTSIFSPLCQTLLNETALLNEVERASLETNSELLVIRLEGVVIGYTTFDVIDSFDMRINNIYFRSIIKDHNLAEYWLSRQLKRYLRNNSYHSSLLAS